jgi:hypothetical protein
MWLVGEDTPAGQSVGDSAHNRIIERQFEMRQKKPAWLKHATLQAHD